jgi:prefoldin subunit 5
VKFQTDYLHLKQRLETLPHELRYDVMVPISKVAFMPGRLVNTNEILVLLGDSWFVEKSAKQACDLIDRRLTNIKTQIEEINKEKSIYGDQIKWTENLINEKGEYVNIEEKLDDSNKKQERLRAIPVHKKRLTDDEIRELRRKQQEKALKTQKSIDQELKKLREAAKLQNKIIKQESEDEEDDDDDEKENYEIVEQEEIDRKKLDENFMDQLAKQFEQLDTGEKFNKDLELENLGQESELDSMIKEYDQGIDRENNKAIEKVLSHRIGKAKKHVKWVDSKNNEDLHDLEKKVDYDEGEDEEEDYDDEDDDFDSEEYYDDKENEIPKADSSKTRNPIVIKIKHTQSEELCDLERRRNFSRDKPQLDNPGDIYNMFYKPKSILRNKNDTILVNENFSNENKSNIINQEPKNALNEKFEPQKVFCLLKSILLTMTL